MVRSLISVILLLVVLIVNVCSKKNDGNLVMSLTKENFTTTIAEYEFVLVNFYAPWCGHCKTLAPEFQKAAAEMSASPLIKFAKVDATENDELAYEHQVRAYPTLRFFRNNVAVQYTGGSEAKDIIAWINKELEPPVKQLKTNIEVERFLKEHPIAVIGFFNEPNTEKANVFNAVATEMKELSFGTITEVEIIASFELNPDNIVLFKPFDEGKVIFNGSNERETLKRFIELESLPLIMEFEQATASKILHGPTKAILLFFISDDSDQQLVNCVKPLTELAKSYRDHVLFVSVTYDDKDKKRAFEYFGITKSETPTIRLIKINENDELIKYKPSSDKITVKTVDDFIQQYIEGCLCRHYISQILPDDWDEHPVKTLVASNFYSFAYDEQRTVLVEFYAPWCGHCKQLEPILEQLANRYEDNDEIVIAKINGVSNEVENLKVTNFPTIKLFLKHTNEIINYNGARTLEGLDEFLQHYGGYVNQKDEL